MIIVNFDLKPNIDYGSPDNAKRRNYIKTIKVCKLE
jgi:hypothetical protein